MANYNNLKDAIKQVIKQNGNQEITGNVLQNTLLSMINSLGDGYQFMGVATPSTNPGTPDQKVFYLAYISGDYPNFSLTGLQGISVIYSYGDSWKSQILDLFMPADVSLHTNIFDPVMQCIGYALDNESGIIYKNSDFSVSKYIPVEPSTVYRTNVAWVKCLYKQDGSFLEYAPDATFTTPENAAFIRLTVRNNFKLEDGYVVRKDVSIRPKFNSITADKLADNSITAGKLADNSITADKLADNSITADKLADNSITAGKLVDNLLIKGDSVVENAVVYSNYFWDFNTFEPAESNLWEYLELNVNSGESYYIKANAGLAARLWYIYTEDNRLLALSNDSSAVSIKEDNVSIPKNGKKLIINNRIDNKIVSINNASLKINANAVYIDNPVMPIKEYIDNRTPPANSMYGKTLVCCGDSITYGADMDSEGIAAESSIKLYYRDGSGFKEVIKNALKTYGYQIAERNNMVFYNDGISSSTMQGLTKSSGAIVDGFSVENGRYTTLPDNIDYLTIFFGWNDAAYGTLGTIDDTTNQSYYGGYNVVLPYLINKYPYTKIALIVPFGATDGHRNAVRALANKWGLACFDMYQGGTPLYYGKESSVNVEESIITSNRAKFQANGAHPNYRGHCQIGNMLEHFLRGI